MSIQFDPTIHIRPIKAEAEKVSGILTRMNRKLQRDDLVQKTVDQLQGSLQVERVVLYHFYREWEGQVTFEALSDQRFSILGMNGPDQCFTDDYADLYLAGRVRAIADILEEPINPCHRDFLSHLQVRANLAVPILPHQRLWGLLIAHHCNRVHAWSEVEIKQMKTAAQSLSIAPSIVS